MKSGSRLTCLTFSLISLPLGAALAQEEKITYQDHLLPMFENKCLNCHNPDEAKGGLDLSSYGATMTGGSGGAIAVSEDPLGSRLYTLMAHKEEPFMPPKKPMAPDNELAVIQQWINGGLLETKSSKAKAKPKMDMKLLTATGKPEGPPPMPEHLILQPEVLTDRPATIPAVAHSQWAPILAVAGQKQVLLYHSADFELLGVLPYPEGFPQVLEFSQNGSLLMCGGGRAGKAGNVVAWDIKTGERVIEVGKEFDNVLGADISPGHNLVVMGGPGKNIKLWDTVKGEQISSIKKHPDWMLTADFSPDGVLFATGGRAAGLYVWEAETGYEFYTLKGHTKSITDMSWRPDSNVLATSSEDGQIILWEMGNGGQVKKWAAHAGGAMAVAYAPDGRIASAGRDKKVKVWGGDGAIQKDIAASDEIVMTVCFSNDSKRVISGDYNGKIVVWDAAAGTQLAEISANPGSIDQQLAYSQQRITELTTNLPKMEGTIKTAATELAATRAKFEVVKKAAAEAAAKKAAMDKLVAMLDAQVKTLTEQQKQTQAALTAKQADAKTKNDAFTAVNTARTAVQAEVTKWTGEMKKADAAAKAAATNLAAAKTAAEKPLLDDATQKALNAAVAAVTASDTARKQADAALAAKKKAEQDAGTKLAAAQKVQTDGQNNFNAKQKAVQDARAKATAADTAAKAAAANLATASKDGKVPPPPVVQAKQQADQALAAAKQALTAATNAFKPVEAQLNTLKQQTVAAQNVVNTAKQQAVTATAQAGESVKKLASANAALKPLRDKETAAKAVQVKAKQLFAQRTTENTTAVNALNGTKTQLAAAQKKFTDADGKFKTAQAAKTAADAEVQKAGAAHTAKTKVLTDTRTQLAAAQKEAPVAAKLAETTKAGQDNQQKVVEAAVKKEADSKKAFEVAKNDLETSKYLVKKWEAASVNLQVRDEGEALDDMEVQLDDMEEEVVVKQDEEKKAEASRVEAEKTLADAQKTVETGRKELAVKTSNVLDTILELASAKAAAELKKEIVGDEAPDTEANPDTAVAAVEPGEKPDSSAEAAGTGEPAPEPEPATIEVAAAEILSEKPREEIEKELLALRERLSTLEGTMSQFYQEADKTKKTVEQASAVASKTPAVIAERTKVETEKEAEARKAMEEKTRHEAALAAQKKKIEELRQKYLQLFPKKEG